jgi:RNA-directed DNA polymerase
MKTRQKSDGRIVPQGRRKSVSTRANGGGKASTVEEEVMQQLGLPFTTAEALSRGNAGAKSSVDRSTGKTAPTPKVNDKDGKPASVTMEAVIERLTGAFEKVAANKGAPGPDGQTIEEVEEIFSTVRRQVSAELLAGTYEPGSIRRVLIPKSSGGHRGLGIPNVVDRMVQEAVRSVLESVFNPTFHPNSHGFRPGRGCQTAIAAAQTHLVEGYEWVVDIDLEKFFDQVNHQRLMSRLAQRVDDKRVLILIGRMLRASVVMPDGVKVATAEGVPQGGPLSPLLSNIVLDELDWELDQRGHRFVRYADDCNIYVRSERAGQRVMTSVTSFIERRLRLKVNASKSAVARPETRHFLGYRLRVLPEGGTEVLLSERSVKRLAERVVELTPRNWGNTLEACITKINEYFSGWFGHFGICTSGIERVVNSTDAHIRRRMRAILLRQWKSKATIARRMRDHGVKDHTVDKWVYGGRQSTWALSMLLSRALGKLYFVDRGFAPLIDRFLGKWNAPPAPAIVAPVQLTLPWATMRS